MPGAAALSKYEVSTPSELSEPVIRQIPPPTKDSKFLQILSDQDVRNTFDRDAYKKLFFSTSYRDAATEATRSKPPRVDVKAAHCPQLLLRVVQVVQL